MHRDAEAIFSARYIDRSAIKNRFYIGEKFLHKCKA